MFSWLVSRSTWVAGYLSMSSSTCSRRKLLMINGTGFYGPDNQSTDDSQWPGLILSPSTTGLVMGGGLHRLCGASTTR